MSVPSFVTFSTFSPSIYRHWVPLLSATHFWPSIYSQWVRLVSATPLTVLYQSFWNFAYVFFRRASFHLFVSSSVYIYSQCLVSATSYSFVTTLLKLFMCFLLGMSICMWFGYNCLIIFLSLFPHCELSYFSPSIYRKWVPFVTPTPLTVLYLSLWYSTCVFFMVWGCLCGLDIIVRLFFVTFTTLWT